MHSDEWNEQPNRSSGAKDDGKAWQLLEKVALAGLQEQNARAAGAFSLSF